MSEEKITEEEFLKEHPSLVEDYIWCTCGKQIFTYLQPHKYAGCYMCPIHGHIKIGGNKHNLTDFQKRIIHETQLDKQKVKGVIDDNVEPPFNEKLKKELGLE